MVFLKTYIANAERLFQKYAESGRDQKVLTQMMEYLSDTPMAFIRKKIKIQRLRNNGIFFTNRKTANHLISLVGNVDWNGVSLWDPCCGAGDLLLAAISNFPIKKKLSQTLLDWETRIYGNDKIAEFIELSKVRIIFLAISMGAHPDIDIKLAKTYLSNIKKGNTLSKNFSPPSIDLILINPPYTKVQHRKSTWSNGQISQAALFIESVLNTAQNNTKILAILPDVLRSGSRYEKWRDLINSIGSPNKIEPFGKFDKNTDVDVFFVDFVKGKTKPTPKWWMNDISLLDKKTLGDIFRISIGPVVPHRDPLTGTESLYLTARDLTLWANTKPNKKRKFSGTLFTPPFLVIKRTSSPYKK